ncbi:MAG: putative nucleic acid-binding protein [Haloarculaceae archaeon]|jgi:predicted nucleic acid-binding protein
MDTVVLDNSFAGPLLEEQPWAAEYVRDLPPETNIVVPSLVRYEAYAGAVKSDRKDLTIQRVAYALDAFQTVGFDESQAREAAEIRGHLLATGQELSAPDVLIAGVVRSIDGVLVTLDGHFERVPDLDVERLNPDVS